MTEKSVRKFCSTHFYQNMQLLSLSRNYLQTPSSDDVLAGNLTILVENLIRWSEVWNIFDWPHYAGDIWNISGT